MVELIGQDSVKAILARSVGKKVPFPMILYGPPGTGKTTIARAYCNDIGAHSAFLNAVTADKKEISQAIETAKMFSTSIIVLDEVHRLDKAKQDLLLPYLEDGTFILIGCTTANPYIAINRAIRSRTRILEIKPLSQDQVVLGLKRAVSSKDGLSDAISFDEDAYRTIARLSGGDLRFALNCIEQCYLQYGDGSTVTQGMVEEIERVPNISLDKDEDEHYDVMSGLQKSIRGSQVDAALYYLAKLLAGEDIATIARRLVIIAYEDVGLGNPAAVARTLSSVEVAERVGMPEAVLPLGMAVVELALSPKSRAAADAIGKAMEAAEQLPFTVRDYIRYTPVNLKEEEKYPYDRPDLWEKIEYMPRGFENVRFYVPNDNSISSIERALNENYKRLMAIKRSSDLPTLKKKKN